MARYKAMPVAIMGKIGSYELVKLLFAWTETDDVPLILGQANFFVEFEVHFYRARYEFEVVPRTK